MNPIQCLYQYVGQQELNQKANLKKICSNKQKQI